MICGQCNHKNQSNTQFCVNCGAKLAGGAATMKCHQGHIYSSSYSSCPYCPQRPIPTAGSANMKGKTKMIPSGTPSPQSFTPGGPQGSKGKTKMIPSGIPSQPQSPFSAQQNTAKKTVFMGPGGTTPSATPPPQVGVMSDMVNRYGTSPLVGFLVSYNHLNDRFGAFWPVRVGSSVIGRGDEADIKLESPDISREHVKLVVRMRKDGHLIWIEDAGSHIGTFCDGEEIGMSRVEIKHGSRLKIGRVEMTFVLIQ